MTKKDERKTNKTKNQKSTQRERKKLPEGYKCMKEKGKKGEYK